MNQRLKNGDILEIPLNNEYGFGYAKFLNSKKVWSNNNLPDVLLIFKFNCAKTIDNIAEIKERELLIAPVAIAGSNGILKSGWRLIGNELILERDKFLPYVKTGWPPLIPNPEKWAYYEDLGDTTKMHFSEYDKVSHLEYSRVLHINVVPFRITMELMKLEGKDIKKMIGKLDWLEEVEYNQSFDIPPYSK